MGNFPCNTFLANIEYTSKDRKKYLNDDKESSS